MSAAFHGVAYWRHATLWSAPGITNVMDPPALAVAFADEAPLKTA
jgi:hypothetical protein